jgi:streptogramin lyase
MRQVMMCFSGRRMRHIKVTLAIVSAAFYACAALPASASAVPTTITEFPVDVGHPVNLEGLVVGSDGNVWFQDYWWPEGSFHALIGRMDEAGNVEEFDKGLHKYSSPAEFVAGPDGNIWFADRGSAIGGAAIGRVAPDGTITRFTAGLGGSRPRTIMVGPDGNLWFTGLEGSPAIGFATPDGAITAFHLPGEPLDAVGGPDGNIWFTYGGDGVPPAIGRLVMKEDGGAVITLFHSGLAADSRPREIIAAQDGNLWFRGWNERTPFIARVSTSGEIKEFSAGLDPEGFILDIATGPTGDIWFTNGDADYVGRISPDGQITLLGNGELDDPQSITPGPDGNMWFTFGGGIGKITPSGVITRLRQGLSPSANPEEIVNGRGGRLWFISKSWTDAAAIGRIIPGDDNPSPSPEPSHNPLHQSSVIGTLALQRTTIPVSRSGKAIIRLACRSSTPCLGNFLLVAFRTGWRAGRLIGASPFSIGAWGSAGIHVQLNQAGRRLARAGTFNAQLRVTPSPGVSPLNRRLKLRPAPQARSENRQSAQGPSSLVLTRAPQLAR